MGLSVAVLALSGVVLGAVSTDIAVGARAETMVGSAPVVPTEPPRASFGAELTPLAGVELEDHRFRVVIRYNPRFFLRRPNILGLDRPVFLNRGSADERLRLSRTVTFRSNLSGSIGEVDYVGLASVLSRTQLSQVNQSVIRLYEVEQRLGVDVRASRRTTLLFNAFVGKGGAPDLSSSIFPTHTRLGGGPTLRYLLTRRDELRLPASVEYHRVNAAELAAETIELDWDHRISRRTRTTLVGGTFASEYLDSRHGSNVLPVASASVEHGLVIRRGTRLDGRIGVGVRPILNLLFSEYRPLAYTEGSLAFSSPPHWTAALRASLYTAATTTPLPTNEPETFFAAEAPIVYTIDPNWSVEVGARSFFLSPHLRNGFDVKQLQLWGYAAVTGVFGTEPEPRQTLR